MGSPLKYVEWVEKIQGDFNAVLNLAKEDIIIRHCYRVRQGDNLSPTLSIIALQLVAEYVLEVLNANYHVQ